MTPEQKIIDKIRPIFCVCCLIFFILGLVVGFKAARPTIDESDYTNTITEIEVPIGKLSSNSLWIFQNATNSTNQSRRY